MIVNGRDGRCRRACNLAASKEYSHRDSGVFNGWPLIRIGIDVAPRHRLDPPENGRVCSRGVVSVCVNDDHPPSLESLVKEDLLPALVACRLLRWSRRGGVSPKT